ncbi:MAG: hypothetical protein ACRCX7_08905 [Cetobacterium sp.]|uniref:hypothetical protein n=1 Tax=Cetobacterium sp. TaxID=2071632 RepID=UPI003F2E9117
MEKEYLKSTTQKLLNCKGGVDTIGILFNTDIEIVDIKGLSGIIDKYTAITGKNEIILVVKPSQSINGGVELTDVKETLAFVEEIKIQLGLNGGTLKRIDFSVDLNEDFESNKKLFRLLLECLDIRRKSAGTYETKKPVKEKRKTGNLKITSKRVQTTAYNSSDKNRISKTRFENRILDIQTPEELEKRILYELKRYIKELHKLEELVPMVEDFYINFLIEEYKESKGKYFRTFTGFVEWADKEQLILTERVLKEVLKVSGITTRFQVFVREFRRTRKESLKFTNKTEIKKIILIVKKELKKIT